LVFQERGRKVSPYDAWLDKLQAAPAGSGLEADSAQARTSLGIRAKKKGMRLSFAERDGKLYVRLLASMTLDLLEKRKSAVKQVLKLKGPLSYLKITNQLRLDGDEIVDGSMCESILRILQKAGEVVLQEGGTVWNLAPRSHV
jgi:hypothetical protein